MAGELLYGFHQLADIVGDRVNATNIPQINAAVQQAVGEYNRQLDAMLGLFTRRTTDAQIRYKQFGNYRSQPLDQDGRARPIKPAGHYDVAFPIQSSGNAWGANYVTRAHMTVQDANDATVALLSGDTAWMTDHILAALFAASPWPFDDEERGQLTIQPLANGDSVTYGVLAGAASAATDTHQFAQADAIADATNPFPTMHKELVEHPENAGEVVALIASDLRDDIEALATFRERTDPNIRAGANTDELVGTLNAAVPGTVIGYVSGVWIVEWAAMPSGYILGVTTDGQPPLAQREYDIALLQGFRLVGERDDHPFYESQYARWTGFGGWNRVGAVAWRIGNASYAVPSGFASPMP